jgi:hypothetical protein
MRHTHKCRTKFCRGITTPGGRSPYCGKCRSRRWKAVSPLKYCYAKLRNRAKERGHEFLLTFGEYEEFAKKTGYDKRENRGKTKYSLSIHRIDGKRGYVASNIAAITLSINSRMEFANIPESVKQRWLEEARNSQQKESECQSELSEP